MTENPESSNRVPVADLAVDACSARGESQTQLERELQAFKRSNERIIYDYNMLARDTRYAEAMQRAAERDAIAAIDREKQMEQQRNTLNETCQSLRVQVGDLRDALRIASAALLLTRSHNDAALAAITNALSSPNTAGEPHRGAH